MKKLLIVVLLSGLAFAGPTSNNYCTGSWSHEENNVCLQRMLVKLQEEEVKVRKQTNMLLELIINKLTRVEG